MGQGRGEAERTRHSQGGPCLIVVAVAGLWLLEGPWEGHVWLPPASHHPCHSYSLSCELEPPSESASNTLKSKNSTAIVKRWSE